MAGNTSVSSLMSSVAHMRASQQTYNDAYAADVYDKSSKTQDDLSQYNGYLKQRQGETVDPGKQLTLQRQMEAASKTYSGAEIRRVGDQVLLGDASNTDKLNKLNTLYQQARASGNASYADELYSQYLSLSKTVQQEAQTASNQTKSANDQSVTYNVDFAKRTQQLTDEALRNGQISPQEHSDRMFNALSMERQAYQDAISGKHGVLTDSAKSSAANSLFQLEHGSAFQDAQARAAAAQNGVPDQYLQHTVRPDGTIETKLAQRPGAQTTFAKDPKTGKMVPTTTYAGGYQGAKTVADAAKFNADTSKPFIIDEAVGGGAPGTKSVIAPNALGNAVPVDAKGDPMIAPQVMRPDLRTDSKFFGTNHFINADPNADLQMSPSAITTDDLKLGKSIGAGDVWNAFTSSFNDPKTTLQADFGHLGDSVGSAASYLRNLPNTILGQVQHATANRAQVAAQQQAAAAQALATARQNSIKQAQAAAAGAATAKTLGPAATPAQVANKVLYTAPAPTAANPNPLPVDSTIQQAFAVAKQTPQPAPAPQTNWWNNITNTIGSWFK